MSHDINDVWDLPRRHIGRRVLVFDQIDSTNSAALDRAGLPQSDGLAFLADEQVAGRGQHGRRWLAAPRSSVLLSVLLYPPAEINRPAILTAWAAVSVCEVARRSTGIRPRIKWPNDVLLRGRKVCGILIEQSRQGSTPATVVGIGLNVTQDAGAFQAAGLPQATSLQAMGAENLDTHSVARELLQTLDDDYTALCQGDRTTLEGLWQWHLDLRGKEVVVECLDGTFAGRLVECGFDGIVLTQPGQPPRRLVPEAILHIQRS